MMQRKQILSMLLAAAAVTLLAGCGSRTDVPGSEKTMADTRRSPCFPLSEERGSLLIW